MSVASAIEMGQAFVKLFAADEQLLADLKASKDQILAWTTSTTTASAVSAKSVAAAAAGSTIAAQSSIAATSAITASAIKGSTSKAAGGIKQVDDALGRLQARVKALWTSITSSVLKMSAAFGSMLLVANKSGIGGGAINGLLDVLRGPSVNRMASLASVLGSVTGNSFLKSSGGALKRANWAADLTQGFNRGGLRGLLAASMRTSFDYALTSAGSYALGAGGKLARGLIGAITSPLQTSSKLIGGTLSLAFSPITALTRGVSGLASGLSRLVPGAKGVASAVATVNAEAAKTPSLFARVGSIGSSLFGGMLGIGKMIAGVAAAGVAAATTAAKQFANQASEIQKKARETGMTIGQSISKFYGSKMANQFISPADIAMGVQMQKVFDKLGSTIKIAWAQVGAAVMPVMIRWAEWTTRVVLGINQWVSQNRDLIQTLFYVGTKIGALAAGAAALFGVFYVAGPVISAFVGPIGAAIAVVGGLYALLTRGQGTIKAWADWLTNGAYSGSQFEKAINSIGEELGYFEKVLGDVFEFGMGNFAELQSSVITTVNGIVDALATGDMETAAKIGLSGVQSVWITTKNSILEAWTGLYTNLGTMLIDSGWMETFNSALTHIENGLTRLTQWFTGWWISFKKTLGLINEEQAKQMKEANKSSSDAIVARRTEQLKRDNQTIRENPQAVKDEMAANQQREIARLRAERAEAQNLLQQQTAVAAEKRQRFEANFTRSADVPSIAKSTAVLQIGGAFAGGLNAGGSPMAKLEKASSETASNTRKLVQVLEGTIVVSG